MKQNSGPPHGPWSLLISTSLWVVAVVCRRLLDGCLGRRSYFLEAVGHKGNAHAKRATRGIQKDGLGPDNTEADVAALMLCRMLPFFSQSKNSIAFGKSTSQRIYREQHTPKIGWKLHKYSLKHALHTLDDHFR